MASLNIGHLYIHSSHPILQVSLISKHSADVDTDVVASNQLKRKDLTLLAEIGHGFFGTVHKGRYMDSEGFEINPFIFRLPSRHKSYLGIRLLS